jgi:hypothetical protein
MSTPDILALIHRQQLEIEKKTTIPQVVSDTDIASAIALKHTQGTDQYLDEGGANEVTAAATKTAYNHSQATHAPTDAQKTLVVGSVYLNTTNVNPGTELGFGTWVALGTLTTSGPNTLYVWERTV